MRGSVVPVQYNASLGATRLDVSFADFCAFAPINTPNDRSNVRQHVLDLRGVAATCNSISYGGKLVLKML